MLLRFLLAASALLLAGCTASPNVPPQGASAIVVDAKSAEARTRDALERIAALNPRLRAVITTDPSAVQQARTLDRIRRARGPLFGMPILIKDNIETAGPLPTTAGSLALAANVTGRDAPLVARLRQAGAVIVGKANLSEWANIRSSHAISGWSAIGGQTRNPHALDRNPCGSSSGSAAAVAAGMVPAAIGTETDGSITCPAAVNGIVGFKPSVGLISRTHVIPISHSQDTPGPLSRTVGDAALLLAAMTGSDPADPATAEADARRQDYPAMLDADALRGRRIGVMRFASGFGTDLAFDEALATLRAKGAVLVDIDRLDGRAEMGRHELTVLLREFKQGLNAYLASTPPSVQARSLAEIIAFNRQVPRELALFGQDLFEQAEAMPGLDEEYRRARATSLKLAGAQGIDRLLRAHRLDALVGPTMPAAWPIDPVHGDQIGGGGAGSLAAIAGYPHLTVPMGEVMGLPVGLSFIGPKWSDGLILALGFAYEQASMKRVEPSLRETVEERPDVARLLEPAR